MICDHILVYVDHDSVLRYLTRVAMPLFFIISGHVVRKIHGKRLFGIAMIGLVLPLIFPWIDNPNVLFLYAVFVPIIVVWKNSERDRPMFFFAIACALTYSANDYPAFGNGYDPVTTFAIMCLGALVPTWYFVIFDWIPRPIRVIGSYPLSIYVGHLFLLGIIAATFKEIVQ